MSDSQREKFPSIPGLQFLEKLGSGAVGSVYLARDERLRRLVAVKVLRRELAGNRLYVERLRREANLSMRLDHPNIVKGLDLGDLEGVLYFEMEFVDGKSLKTVLRERGRLEEDEVLEYGLQVARALDHAYRHGVVHRDIKPGNLMLARDGTLKLADLGLARRPDDSSVTRDGVTLGTPHYISPEQALDPSSADVRSDLYSLGATLFHAATGKPPFDAETVAGVLSQVLEPNTVAVIPDDVPISRNLQLVLRRLLAKDPQRRYQAPDDLIRDLERVRRRERPQVSRFDLSPVAGKRLRAAVSGVTAVALMGGLLWGVATWAGHGAPAPPSEAERQLSAKLTELEGDRRSDPPALAERWKRVGAILQLASIPPGLRVRAVDLQTRLAEQLSAASASLERACEQDLASAIAEGRFADANDLIERSFPQLFRDTFGAATTSLPESVGARIDQFLEAKQEEVGAAVARSEEALAGELPTFLARLDTEVAGDCAKGNYRAAIESLDSAMTRLELEGGASWKKLPAASKERLAERARPRTAELRARTLEGARDVSQRLGAKLLREHDRLEAALGSGQRAAAASEFEELARQMLDDANYRRDEWPAQVRPDPSKVAEDLTTSLRNFERERVREVAERAFGELDGRLAGRLRERQYSTARLEWQGRMERSSYAPVREKMARRAQYCDSLIALRDRVRTNLARQIGKRVSLTLRSGTALVGKLTAAEGHADDFTIKLAEGPTPEAQFSALSGSDIEKLAEFTPSGRDRYQRGILWLAEGELDRAQADFAAAKALAADDADLSARAEAALGDVDTLRFVAKGGPTERDERFEESKKKARGYAAIGEWDLARDCYSNARKEAAGFERNDPRLAELENEIQQFDSQARDQKRARELSGAFPGAQTRELGEGRLELRYSFAETSSIRGLELGADWKGTPDGLRYSPKGAAPASELGKLGSARLELGALVRAPLKATFRVTVPFDGNESEEAVRIFQLFGKTVVFANGLARHTAATWIRGSSLDGVETDLQRLTLDGAPKVGIGLLRGGTHDVTVAIEGDGKTVVVSLDTVPVARGEGISFTDLFEVRSTSPLLWRELRVEGRILPKK
jgi:serine/threonine-protein kinase